MPAIPELRRDWVLAFGGSALVTASYSCRAPWWVPCLALAVFAESIRRRNPRRAAVLGFVQGSVASGVALYWLPSGLSQSSGCSPVIAYALAGAAAVAFGARFGFAAWFERRCVANGSPEGIGLLFGYVAGELLVAGPMPWYLGATVHRALPLIQVADLFGPIAASATVIIVGLTLRAVFRLAVERTHQGSSPGASKRTLRAAFGWSLASTAVLAYGLWGFWIHGRTSKDDGPSVRVGIVQPNIHPAATPDEHSAIMAVRDQVLSTWHLADRGAELVIWPETAVRVAIPAADIRALYPRLFSRDLGVPAVIGASLGAPGDHHSYNAVVSLDRRGAVLDVYKKRRLAPFTEDFPGRDRLHAIAMLFPDARITAGDESNDTVTVLDHRASIFICYEILFPNAVRESVAKNASGLILNVANDGWFGDTWEPGMHLAAAKLRAVENRRYLVRAAATGISAVVDPWGRARGESAAASRGDLLSAFSWNSEPTPYQRWGDGPLWLATAAVSWVAFRKRSVEI